MNDVARWHVARKEAPKNRGPYSCSLLSLGVNPALAILSRGTIYLEFVSAIYPLYISYILK